MCRWTKTLNITDDSRIVASLPAIKSVLCQGGCAIIISHLGRPKMVMKIDIR